MLLIHTNLTTSDKPKFIECLYLNTIEQLFQFVKDFAFRPQFLQFLSSLRLLKLLGIQIKTSSLNFNILLMHNFASIKKKMTSKFYQFMRLSPLTLLSKNRPRQITIFDL